MIFITAHDDDPAVRVQALKAGRNLPEQTVQCGYYEANKFCRVLS
jgi:hypothetical protein